MRSLLGLLALGLAAACGGPTQPTVQATVDVGVDAVVADVQQYGVATWLSFDVPVTITNAGPDPVRVAHCAYAVEQPTLSGWRTVWSSLCMADVVADMVIPPGEARDVTFHIGGSLTGSVSPRWEADAIGGTYRLRVGLMPVGSDGAVPMIASDAFVVAE
ncbi:MAG TPA: hypothetical protein VFO55_02745 [Gemmatimonadaceae bacterium]|nr:hypothetical protein [Gemmatimonadaceae bacterium]